MVASRWIKMLFLAYYAFIKVFTALQKYSKLKILDASSWSIWQLYSHSSLYFKYRWRWRLQTFSQLYRLNARRHGESKSTCQTYKYKIATFLSSSGDCHIRHMYAISFPIFPRVFDLNLARSLQSEKLSSSNGWRAMRIELPYASAVSI